ncbi:MAG: hypothetical protein AABW58_03955 [Nanoarchaeota archaeon]
MVSEEIKKWLEEAKKRGYSNDQIKSILEKQGYQKKDITEILGSENHLDFIKKDKLAILLVSLIIIIGILGFILSNNLIKVPVKKQSGGSENLILSEFPNNYGECINQNNQWCFSLNFNDFNPVNCFDKQEDCEGDKLRQIALKENDLSICNNINLEDRKDICFAGFALKDKNLDLCEKIINEETKTECLYLIIINLKNKGLCEKLSSQKKEECITYFA